MRERVRDKRASARDWTGTGHPIDRPSFASCCGARPQWVCLSVPRSPPHLWIERTAHVDRFGRALIKPAGSRTGRQIRRPRASKFRQSSSNKPGHFRPPLAGLRRAVSQKNSKPHLSKAHQSHQKDDEATHTRPYTFSLAHFASASPTRLLTHPPSTSR